MAPGKRIPIPWRHRWRRIRYSAVPVVVFCACLAATMWLWHTQAQMPNAVGQVERTRVAVASDAAGRLLKVKLPRGFDLASLTDLANLNDLTEELDDSEKYGEDWTLFDKVEQDEIIARLDHRRAKARLKTLTLAVDRLRKEVVSTVAQIRLDDSQRQMTQAGVQLSHQRQWMELIMRKLDVADRKTLHAVDTIDLETRDLHLKLLAQAFAKGAISPVEYKVMVEKPREQVEARLRQSSKALEEAETLTEEAAKQFREHLKKYPELQLAEVSKLLAPLEVKVDEQLARVSELEMEIKSLLLRAPIDGTICDIFHRPGDVVQAGEPIVMIAADTRRYAVTYLRPDQRIRPVKGMLVSVRTRAPGSRRKRARVEEVGPQYEEVPLHQRRDPLRPEWALPVRIALPERGFDVRPGELIEIQFRPRTTDKAG